MMKLSVLKGRRRYWPTKAACPWCKKGKVLEPHSFAILQGGALLMNRQEKIGRPDDAMDGFFDLSWHGAHDGGVGDHREIFVNLRVADGVHGGQFEIYFCSTTCLRAFLNECVDKLDAKIMTESAKQKRRSGVKKKRG